MRRSPIKRGRGFAASAVQREKVAGERCLVCRREVQCDPAHVVPRSRGGCDHPDCVVPLCRWCHDRYDCGALDLLPWLEVRRMHGLPELAHGLEHVGLLHLLRITTGQVWTCE